MLLFSHSVVSDLDRHMWLHGLQNARFPCPPTSLELAETHAHWVCDATSVICFSSCLQYFPASESFLMSLPFASGGQSIGASVSASVLLMNIKDSFPLGLPGLICLQSKGLSRVFSSTTVQKHQFFGVQLSL